MNLNTKTMAAVFIAGLQSCSSPSGKISALDQVAIGMVTVFTNDSRQELKKTGEVVLTLDEHSSYEFFNVRYINFDNEEFLYVLNQLNASMDIYSLNEQKLISRISYKTEGPEGIQQVQGFTVAGRDSIFLFPRFELKGSLLINNKGEVLNQYSPAIEDSEIPGHINHISSNSNQTYYHDQKLYFHRYPFSEVKDLNFYYDFYYDLEKNETKWMDFSVLPEEYFENDWLTFYHIDSRIMINEKEWVYSWSMLDSLIYIKREDGVTEKQRFYAGDQRMVAPILEQKNKSPEEYEKLKQDMTNYGQLLYSPKQGHFYRILYLKQEENPVVKTEGNSIFGKKFLLITLNRDFDILNKTLFDAGVYDPRVMFAGESGIYIPKISPYYSQLNEDQIVYDVFRLQN